MAAGGEPRLSADAGADAAGACGYTALHIGNRKTEALAREVARSARRKYGKGRHVTRLNIGDCVAYALSRTSGEPLLRKGAGFPRTDARLVPY
jgi:uncharacterized protein with PIN domain